jgi:hypothetical protein
MSTITGKTIRRNLSEAAANDAQAAHWMQRSAEAEAMESAGLCCSGDCRQRRDCPVYQACQRPETSQRALMYRLVDERRAAYERMFSPFFRGLLAAVAICAALAVVAAMFGGRP